MLGTRFVGSNKREVDVGGLRRGESNLGLLGLFFKALHGHLVITKVNPLLIIKFITKPVNDSLIPIVTAEKIISIGRFDLKDPVAKV